MLKFIKSITAADYEQLMRVYEESNRRNGVESYPQYSSSEQLLMAEQDLYCYLCSVLQDGETALAVWAPEGQYKAALRLEPYADGQLITALETAPDERRKGYAERLLSAVLVKLDSPKVYSHVANNNIASVRLHEKCGFSRMFDHAVYLDGSVSTHAWTYCFLNDK